MHPWSDKVNGHGPAGGQDAPRAMMTPLRAQQTMARSVARTPLSLLRPDAFPMNAFNPSSPVPTLSRTGTLNSHLPARPIPLLPRAGATGGSDSVANASVGNEGSHPPRLSRKLALVADGSLPPVPSLEATYGAVINTDDNNESTASSIDSAWKLVVGPTHAEVRNRLVQMHRERAAALASAEQAEAKDTHAVEGLDQKIMDRDSFRRTSSGSGNARINERHIMNASSVDQRGQDVQDEEGLGKTENQEPEEVVQTPLDMSSFTKARFAVLRQTYAETRNRLVQMHRERAGASAFMGHAEAKDRHTVESLDSKITDSQVSAGFGRTRSESGKAGREEGKTVIVITADEKGQEVQGEEGLSETENDEPEASSTVVQSPFLDMSSPTKKCIPFSQQPTKRHEDHENINIAFGSASNLNKGVMEVTTKGIAPPAPEKPEKPINKDGTPIKVLGGSTPNVDENSQSNMGLTNADVL